MLDGSSWECLEERWGMTEGVSSSEFSLIRWPEPSVENSAWWAGGDWISKGLNSQGENRDSML